MVLITEPTRFTPVSKTLTDLCITNSPEKVRNSGVVHLTINGYTFVFITRKLIHPTLNVSRKIWKSIGIIYKSSFCLSPLSLRTLYFSLVYPYLIYCITVWGSTYNYQTNLKRKITLKKKKVIKSISNVPFDANADSSFRDHQILQFDDIYLLQIAKFMFFL